MNRRNPACIPGFAEEQFTFDIGTLKYTGDKKPEVKKLHEILALMPGISSFSRDLIQ